MTNRILIPVFLGMLAFGMWHFAGYLMGDLMNCSGVDFISLRIKCADESLIRLVDAVRLTSIALGLASIFLLVLF